MTRTPPESWSTVRSLAFLAASFAILFGTLLPSAVAASAATGTPITLCSGTQIRVSYDADGQSQPVKDSDRASLDCAMCLLSGLTAIPTPPPLPVPLHPAPALAAPRAAIDRDRRPPSRAPPRPPSTAPPPGLNSPTDALRRTVPPRAPALICSGSPIPCLSRPPLRRARCCSPSG